MTDNSEQTLASNTLHPESQGTLKGIFNVWQKQLFYELQTCMPAIFLGYKDDKRETGMGIVKPLVKLVDADGQTYERGEMELPIRQFQHGTFMIDAPLVEGDTGWLIAGDRDNTNVLLNNGAIQAVDSGIGKRGEQGVPLGNDGPQDPGFLDSHKYLYGFFLPDKWGGIPLPPEMKDSLVIGQVNPNATSHGRFVLDPDGTIHVLSTKWYDAKEQKLRGGAVFVDLSWKGKLPTEIKESWRLGEHQVTAIETILGDLIVKEWEDPDGYAHGGNLKVEHDAEVKGGFVAWFKSAFRSALDVFGDAFFHSKVTVKHNTSRTVTIDPKRDLAQSDAQFREVYIVTGKDFNRSNNGKVALKLERRRILSDEKIDEQPVEFEVGGGGGGDVKTDEISVSWHKESDEAGDELAVKGWHDQYDVNGDGTLPAGEEPKPKSEYDPENEGGDVSLSTIIWQGKGPGYSEYQILARKKPGGPLVYIPIVSGAGSSDSVDSGSEDYDYYIDITQRDIPGTPAHTNGGVEITFQPMKDGQAYGQPTVVTIWHGNDGAPGLPGEDGKDAGIEVTTTPITTTPGGTRVTLTPHVGGQVDPAHPSRTFDIMNGRDGGGCTITGSFQVVGRVQYDMTVTPPQLQQRIDTITVVNGAFVQTPGQWEAFAIPIAHSQTTI